MDDLSIRAATRADCAAIHPVIERAYRGDAARAGWTHEADLLTGARTSVAELEAFVAHRAQTLLIAWQAAKPVGCVAVTDKGGGLAYLGQLCVEPALQAVGLGRRLVDAAEAHAAGFGADRIEMTVIDTRTELIAWYVRRGYHATGERRDFPIALDPPFFMTVLEKPLKPLVGG